MSRIVASALVGLAAFWLALGTGLPVWRNFPFGDATDIGVSVFVAALLFERKGRA